MESFTVELTIEPGEPIEGSAARGFAESTVILRAVDKGHPGSGRVDLAWGTTTLATGITVEAFLSDFWQGKRWRIQMRSTSAACCTGVFSSDIRACKNSGHRSPVGVARDHCVWSWCFR